MHIRKRQLGFRRHGIRHTQGQVVLNRCRRQEVKGHLARADGVITVVVTSTQSRHLVQLVFNAQLININAFPTETKTI